MRRPFRPCAAAIRACHRLALLFVTACVWTPVAAFGEEEDVSGAEDGASVPAAEDGGSVPAPEDNGSVPASEEGREPTTRDGTQPPASAEARAAGSRLLTRDVYMDRVRREFPLIVLQDLRMDAAEARRMEARSAAWPVMDIRAGFAPAPRIDVRLDEEGRPVITEDDRSELDLVRDITGIGTRVDASVTIPITAFGRIRIARELGDLGVDVAEMEREKATREQLFESWRAYLAVQWFTEVSALLQEASRRLDRARDELEDEIDEGNFRARTDLRRLSITSAQFTSLQADANGAGRVARFAIARGLNLPPDFEVDPLEEDLPRTSPSLDDVLDYARDHRPDYRLLDQGVRAAELQLRLRRREFAPELGLILNANIAYTPTVTDLRGPFIYDPFNRFVTGFALGFRWSMNPRQLIARTRRASAELGIAEEQRRAAWLGIQIDVAEAWYAADGAREVYLAQRDALRAAEAWLNQVAFQYDQGLADFADFREPLLTFYQTRAAWYKAVLDYHLALANLALKVGSDDFSDWPVPPPSASR